MDKQNLYVALLNAGFGVLISLLVNGSLLIYSLAFIAGFTVLLIERRRIYEKVFRGKLGWTVGGYVMVLISMIAALFVINQGNRDKALIIQATRDFVGHLKPGEYAQAYTVLSDLSKKSYSEDLFLKDNQRLAVKVNDFRIDGVEFNEFDKNKAVVKVSSPFLIYGQNSMAFEFVKELAGWRLAFTPSILQGKTPQANQADRTGSKRRSSGGLGGAIRSIF